MPPEVTYPTEKPEPTLGELRAGSVNVYVRCSACLHPKWLKPVELRGGDERTLSELASRLRCGRCGEENRIEVSLIPEQWVRHLRATGQTDRLPEDANLYFPSGQPLRLAVISEPMADAPQHGGLDPTNQTAASRLLLGSRANRDPD